MSSPLLFEPFFHGPSWSTWRAVLKAAFAEPMNDAEKAVLVTVGASQAPKKGVRELVAIVGHGGGKDSIASLIATCAAINFDPSGKLRH